MKRTAMMLAILLAVGAAVGAAAAQDKAPADKGAPTLGDGRGQVVLSWDEFVKITGYDPGKKGPQVLTVSWKQVEDLLGVKVDGVKEGTMVDLPWEQFKALLEWSVNRKEKPEAAPPPSDFIVTSSVYSGQISETEALFTLTLKLNILREKGWKRIPVLPATVAIVKSDLKPADGVFLNSTPGAYELITEKAGAVEAVIQFSASITKSGGTNTVSFQRLHPASSVLELTLDARTSTSRSPTPSRRSPSPPAARRPWRPGSPAACRRS